MLTCGLLQKNINVAMSVKSQKQGRNQVYFFIADPNF